MYKVLCRAPGFSLFGLGFSFYEVLGHKRGCSVFILVATHSSNPSLGVDSSETMIILFPASEEKLLTGQES